MLNRKKFYVNINSFRFVRVKTVFKKSRELHVKVIMIPQPDGIDVPVPIIDPNVFKKTLGVLIKRQEKGRPI